MEWLDFDSYMTGCFAGVIAVGIMSAIMNPTQSYFIGIILIFSIFLLIQFVRMINKSKLEIMD